MLLPFTISPSPSAAEGDPPSDPIPTSRADEPFLRAPATGITSGVRPPAPDRDEHVHAVFAASPLAIVALDFAGRVTLWNRAAEDLFGWGPEEALGRTAAPEIAALARSAVGDNAIVYAESTHTRKDGERITARASVAPIGASGGVVAIFARTY